MNEIIGDRDKMKEESTVNAQSSSKSSCSGEKAGHKDN
jgi:hypothetical protein